MDYSPPGSSVLSWQEYWSGLPFPPPGDLPNPGIKSRCIASPALAEGFFTTEPLGKPISNHRNNQIEKQIKGFYSSFFPISKVHLVKAMVFPVVMYGCESWTVKKAERWRIDAFELWCWRRLLRVPWTARRSNQSILEEISPGCSLEGLMLKLKLQYFGHLMQRADSFEKTLILGKIEGRKRRGRQRMRWLDDITNSMDMGFWVDSTQVTVGGQGSLACCSSWGHKESDKTELNWTIAKIRNYPNVHWQVSG